MSFQFYFSVHLAFPGLNISYVEEHGSKTYERFRVESQDELKSKIRRTCENYSKIKIPYQQQKVINNLSNNKSVILKKDKGRGIVILGRKHYIEKCFRTVQSKQFKKQKKDTTKTFLTQKNSLKK